MTAQHPARGYGSINYPVRERAVLCFVVRTEKALKCEVHRLSVDSGGGVRPHVCGLQPLTASSPGRGRYPTIGCSSSSLLQSSSRYSQCSQYLRHHDCVWKKCEDLLVLTCNIFLSTFIQEPVRTISAVTWQKNYTFYGC